MSSRQQIVKDLVELSHRNFDIENIIQEAEYLGEEPRHLAQEVANLLAQVAKADKFSELQDRLENLHRFIKGNNV